MQVIRIINRGGFGIVQEVENGGERLAKKVFSPLTQEPDEILKLQRRFAREVGVQSHIRHPNIMPILAYDLEATPSWFTMPLATESFEQKIVTDRAAGAIDRTAWQDILSGVEELHRLGYVHRDLKPGNVLCANAAWVVADFGLVLPTVRETTVLTGSKSAYGSHFYAAPEQAYDFHNVSEGADIFALGCILHDYVCPNPVRVPFAQIYFGGPYGQIIEKCTASDARDRYPSIAALRAALFELWQTPASDEVVSAEEADLLVAVTLNPSDREAWDALVQHIERLTSEGREPILRQINADLLRQLHQADESLFRRIMSVICGWVESTSFDFSYCDVVGDRLAEIFRFITVRVRCQVVLAALELAVYHNRWHVMHQVRRMLGQETDNDLVDRMIIEMEIDNQIEIKLRAIEDIISVSRDQWHPKIAAYLEVREQTGTSK